MGRPDPCDAGQQKPAPVEPGLRTKDIEKDESRKNKKE